MLVHAYLIADMRITRSTDGYNSLRMLITIDERDYKEVLQEATR